MAEGVIGDFASCFFFFFFGLRSPQVLSIYCLLSFCSGHSALGEQACATTPGLRNQISVTVSRLSKYQDLSLQQYLWDHIMFTETHTYWISGKENRKIYVSYLYSMKIIIKSDSFPQSGQPRVLQDFITGEFCSLSTYCAVVLEGVRYQHHFVQTVISLFRDQVDSHGSHQNTESVLFMVRKPKLSLRFLSS